MDFTFTKEGNTGVFHLSGSLIGEQDGMRLADAFNEQLEHRIHHFILDLTDLKHVNSSGLGVFITLLTRARKKDGELYLANPSEYIRNLMLITKLNSIFHIFDSLQAALDRAASESK